ncbi:ARF3 [Symbiodinium sp. CCMP2456]|nr:ARF3 [Symbiodinium sp. CCMP2456]
MGVEPAVFTATPTVQSQGRGFLLVSALLCTMGVVASLMGGRRKRQLLLVGLDASGKTTMLYSLKAGEVVTTIPTIGFNVETLDVRHGMMNITSMVAWDVGGRDKIRPLWRHYYKEVDALVYMVDCNDRERVDEAKDQLFKLLIEDELADKPLLVFANKQDLRNAMSDKELVEKLSLNQIRDRRWFIQESVATKGKGIYEGLEWLAGQLKADGRNGQRAVSRPPTTPESHELPSKGVLAKPEHPDDVSTADTEDATARAEVITAHS